MKVRIEWKAREDASLEAALADTRLSFRAKGLLALLQVGGTESAFDLKQLAAASSEGKDALRTALAELEVAGYCERLEAAENVQESSQDEEEQEDASVPVMDSLFGASFAPPIPIDELPDARIDEAPEGVPTPEDAAVVRVVDRLNQLRKEKWDWAHYTPLQARYPKNVEQIRRRLREGHTEQDLVLVLEYRAAVDGGDERSRRYFNSDTPFNTRNFEENIALALDWNARGRSVDSDQRFGTERGADYYLDRKRRDK